MLPKNIPASLAEVVSAFEPCFSKPTHGRFVVLVLGWLLCRSRRWITRVVLAACGLMMGHAQEDWAKRLEGDDADVARAALVALKGKAVEPLLAALENGSVAAAFQAALAFGALAKDGKKGFEPLLALAARSDGDRGAPRRRPRTRRCARYR